MERFLASLVAVRGPSGVAAEGAASLDAGDDVVRSQLERHVGRLHPELTDERRREWIRRAGAAAQEAQRRLNGEDEDEGGDVNSATATKAKRPRPISSSVTATIAAAAPSSSSPSPASSFSWFDLANRTPLASLVTAERIQETAETGTPGEVLLLLRQVPYVDDLFSDWSQLVMPLVRDGLLCDDPELSDGYRSLAIEWIESTRSSLRSAIPCSEGGGGFGGEATHWDVQADLLHLLVVSAATDNDSESVVGDSSNAAVATATLVDCFCKTWLDWMLRLGRPAASDARVRAIARCVWLRWTVPGTDGDERPNRALLFFRHLMRRDPNGRWFHAWVDLLPPAGIPEFLQGATDDSTQQPPPLARIRNRVHALLEREDDSDFFIDDAALSEAAHWLCLLRSPLEHLRVSGFPWEILLEASPVPQEGASGDGKTVRRWHGVAALGDLYLRLLSECISHKSSDTSNDRFGEERYDKDIIVAVCCDALETLVWGTRGEEPGMNDLEAKIRTLTSGWSSSSKSGSADKRRLLQLVQTFHRLIKARAEDP